MAYLIEILEFNGPDWLKLQIVAPGFDDERYYLIFESKIAPKSITIGNRAQLLVLSLREEVLIPRRSREQLFYANITAVPAFDNGNVANSCWFKDSRISHSVKVSLWCVTLLINTRFRFFFLNFRISNF